MPKFATLQKEKEELDKSSSTSSAGGELTQTTASEKTADKSAIKKRLIAQGAVSLFSFGKQHNRASPSEVSETAGESESEESEVQEKADQTKSTAPTPIADTPPEGTGKSESAEAEATEEERESQEAFHERVQKQTDAANNPKWHNVSQRIENARYGKWDLSQSRERSGGRKQDINLEEDVRTHRYLNPDLRQKAKNAVNDVVENPGQTVAGMIPLLGSGIKQKLAERNEVRERDLHRGIAATTTSDEIRESSNSREKAVHTKIQGDRAKAVVGTLTGGVGKIVPAYGQAASAAGAAVGAAIDYGTKGSREQVNMIRAREKARKDMGAKETHGFESYEDYQALKKQSKDLRSVGQGKKDANAASIDSPEQAARLTAFSRGEIQFQKQYEKRFKEMEKERAVAAKAETAKDMPKEEGAGLMSKLKSFFKRSS